MHRLGGGVHRADDRRVDLAAAQRLRGQLQRHQAGCLLGADGKARPGEVELRVQPVGHQVRHGAEHAGRGQGRPEGVPPPAEQVQVGAVQPGARPPARTVAVDLRVAAHPDQDHGPLARQHPVADGVPGGGQYQQPLGQRLLQIARREAQAGQLKVHCGHPGRPRGTAQQPAHQVRAVPDPGADRDDGDRTGTGAGRGPGLRRGRRRRAGSRGGRGLRPPRRRHGLTVTVVPRLDDEVCVVAAEAEGADGGQPGAGPFFGFVQ